jgi:hypothetical protein
MMLRRTEVMLTKAGIGRRKLKSALGPRYSAARQIGQKR